MQKEADDSKKALRAYLVKIHDKQIQTLKNELKGFKDTFSHQAFKIDHHNQLEAICLECIEIPGIKSDEVKDLENRLHASEQALKNKDT